jgi:uncharacterized membrane protein YczE
MRTKGKTDIRLLFYFGGLIIMTLGVAISVKSDLGVTPISSIPYTMTVVTGMDLGIATMIFSVLVVLLQILLLRKQYKPINLLQIPVGILFGVFLTLGGKLMNFMPNPTNFTLQFIIMLISTVFVALGVFLYVPAGFIPLAPEGFLLAASKITKIKFSTVKVICAVAMVVISLVTCLVAIHSLGSVGIGTIVAALLVGTEVKMMTKFWGESRDKILGVNDDSKSPVNNNQLINIMKKDIYTIKSNETIADALRMMNEKRVSGLPVLDQSEHLVGFISDGDIIRHLSSEHPLFVNSDSLDKLEFNTALHRILAKEVSSIAEKRVITVNATDDLGDVCYKLTEFGLKKAPVMQGEEMIGVINVSNIIKYAVSLIDRK